MKKLSIIIPVYNEEKFIAEALSVVANADSLRLNKEIIVVDDGSKDGSRKAIENAIKALEKKSHNIYFKTVFKKKNAGKGAAVKDGILASSGDIVLIQDADLEYNPEEYVILLEPFIKHHADVVYGSRFISNRPHRVLYFWHYRINVFLTTLSNMLTNLTLTDMETGYKVFRGDMIRKIAPKLKSRRFGFEPEVTARISKIRGLKIYEVGISYYGRTYEDGKKINWKDGIKAVWQIIYFNLISKV